MNVHWATSLLGKPFVSGGRGPEAFDCWGLLFHVYATRFGVQLPAYPGLLPGDPAAHKAINALGDGAWKPLRSPVDGCGVGLSRNKAFHHVGVFLDVDGGLVLHAYEGIGVVAQTPTALRVNGWQRIAYFDYSP